MKKWRKFGYLLCLCMVMMWAGLLGGCQGSDDETETTAVETDAYDETETFQNEKEIR